MKKYFVKVFVLFLFYGLSITSLQSQTEPNKVYEQEISIHNFDSLESLLYTNSDKIHIINFWAMWCAPCVKELPFFKAYGENNPDVEILLVSLDFPEDIEGKLKPFLAKKGITSKVVLL
ncbi:TlpA family protein disulfide reductase, partial [Cellulophaga fucicola]|uniref:TlpA family protein disulfide reductase n=1 Tax=Cellulophaga fucicola TaxID=76595 RepID=UPI003EC0B764